LCVPSSSAKRSPLSSTWAHVYATRTPPASTRVAPELLFEQARQDPMPEPTKHSARVTHLEGRAGDREIPSQSGSHAEDQIRYGSHPGSTWPRVRRKPSDGAKGWRCRWKPASCGVLSIFLALHRRHAATTFSHTWSPPRERGSTWSRFSAAEPQYWHSHPSRANTARLVSGAWARKGT